MKGLLCDGYTMGRGTITASLVSHAETRRAVMTPEAARTIRDKPEQVLEREIEIGEESDLKDLT